MERRDFLINAGLFIGALSSANSLLAAPNASFKGLKIGYLPISDHLLVISQTLQNSAFSPLKFPSWADLSAALRAKQLDGAFILTPLALKLKSQGLDLKAILAAHRNGSALVVDKSINSKDTNALKGLRIAIPSRFSTHYLLLAKLLKQSNLSINDVKLIDMAPPEMYAALSAKRIDAYIVAEPFCINSELKKAANIFRLSKDISPNHICCVLTFHNEILNKYNAEITKLVGEFLTTASSVKKDIKATSNLATKYLGQKPEVFENLLSQGDRVTYENLALSEEDIKSTINDMKSFGIGELNIAYKDFVDNSFIKKYQ